jgi:spermidine/putrescine transport system permease protein
VKKDMWRMRSVGLNFLRFCVGLVYLFLYLPIIVLVIFSFNDNPFTQSWKGFTFRWYHELWQSTEIWQAIYNSLMVASGAAVLSLVLGLLFVSFCRMQYKERLQWLFYASLAVPEVLIAVALLRFFSIIDVGLGGTTLLAGHTLLGLGYVVPILHTRYNEIDQQLLAAARDLGATQVQTFFTIVFPLLVPSMFAAGLLVFIISLDDFFISFFCTSASIQTLPLYIFSVIRAGATPVVNALSTVLLLVTSSCIFIFSLLQLKSTGEQ